MKWGIIAVCCILLTGCSRKITVFRVSQVNQASFIDTVTDHTCYLSEHYIPDSQSYTQYIRVNVHFMDDTTGQRNFSLEEGRSYMNQLIHNANERLVQNHRMNLPEGNDTPALHPRYQYRVTPAIQDGIDDGYYKHQDNELFYFLNKGRYRNNYDRSVIRKYSIGTDSILNIFVLPHHPDSLSSPHYYPVLTGIALGSGLKMSGLHERKDKPWAAATLMNHEVGHILGLAHSWMRHDGCDDTPVHDNCWQQTEKPPCDGLISNNMMDYNNSQMAITPCQLSIIHKGFATEGSSTRKLLIPQWCDLDTQRNIVIQDTIEWRGARDVKNSIEVAPGGVLRIYCRISVPKGGRITIRPGGTLELFGAHLHNACGDLWEGIFLEQTRKSAALLLVDDEARIEDVLPREILERGPSKEGLR